MSLEAIVSFALEKRDACLEVKNVEGYREPFGLHKVFAWSIRDGSARLSIVSKVCVIFMAS